MISFKPKQSLGQNFLMHARIAERIALVSHVSAEDTVCEIGPGTGMLTKELLKLAKKVIAIEADEALHTALHATFAGEIQSGKLELIHGDIREFDLGTLPRGYALVANIPYYLTGEIFRLFLEASNQPSSITLLVQKEVAERIARSKKESILSLSIKAYGTPSYEFTVPRGAFIPAPKVDSAVLSVRQISRKNFTNRAEEQLFFELVRAGFAHKRKFVRSNLSEAGFQTGAIPEKARAEDLSLEVWLSFVRSK
jgi:16S rRNA (adenine1518-N6/adenine1519-N6)-dimethyltransferase